MNDSDFEKVWREAKYLHRFYEPIMAWRVAAAVHRMVERELTRTDRGPCDG